MAVFGAIVEPLAHLATMHVAEDFHRCGVGAQAIGDDDVRTIVVFQRFLEEFQRCRLVALLRDEGFLFVTKDSSTSPS